jgi:hypothetical protein
MDGIAQDGLPILNKEAKLRVTFSERQGLRSNTASDIDNK